MVRINKTGSRLNFGPRGAFPSLHGTDHTSQECGWPPRPPQHGPVVAMKSHHFQIMLVFKAEGIQQFWCETMGDIPNILANCSQGENKDVSFSVGSVSAWNKNSWFQRQRITLFAFTQSLFSSLKCFRITHSVMPLSIQVVSQSMKLSFFLLVGKCKLSKLVFTITSPFLVPIPCPPNPEFNHKPFNQQHSFCRGLCWVGDSGSRI